MTNQPPSLLTESAGADLEVRGGALSVSSVVWRPGSDQAGLDDRVEFAEVGDRVAVRDPGHPEAPALLLPRADWDTLCTPTTIDLRPST